MRHSRQHMPRDQMRNHHPGQTMHTAMLQPQRTPSHNNNPKRTPMTGIPTPKAKLHAYGEELDRLAWLYDATTTDHEHFKANIELEANRVQKEIWHILFAEWATKRAEQ